MSDADPAAAFDALGDETRVAILRTLVEHRRDDPPRPHLSFSELRKRVGATDSGRFNYHLGKLRDRFVEKTGDGYELTFAGEQMATAVLSGAVADDAKAGPERFDHDCLLCDAPVDASYADGHVLVECCDGHRLLRVPAPPTLVRDRDIETAVSVAVQDAYDVISLAKQDVCRSCYGHMDAGVVRQDYDSEPVYVFEGTCQRCGEHYTSPVSVTLLDHPALVAFFWEHGRDPTSEFPWLHGFLSPHDPPDVISESPLRLRVTVELDGEVFTALVDEDATVVETNTSP